MIGFNLSTFKTKTFWLVSVPLLSGAIVEFIQGNYEKGIGVLISALFAATMRDAIGK